jgi:hypothetical protein
VTLLMDDFYIDWRWNCFPTLKENDIRVIFFLPNTIQISKSLALSLYLTCQRRKCKRSSQLQWRSYRRIHSKAFPLTETNIY